MISIFDRPEKVFGPFQGLPNFLYRSAYDNLRSQGMAFPFSTHDTLVDTRREWSRMVGFGVDSLYDAAYGEYSTPGPLARKAKA